MGPPAGSKITAVVGKPPGFSLYWPFGVNYWSDVLTRMPVQHWLDQDAREHKVADGTTACGRYYQYLKHKTQKLMDDMFDPFGVCKDTLLHNSTLHEFLRSPDMAEQFRFVDSIIRQRYPNESGDLYKPEYNHRFLSENSNGTIVAMDDDAIVQLFTKRGTLVDGKGEIFPHILITSSHAQGETLSDMTSITHGIAAMARDSEGHELPQGHADTGVAPGQTLILFACDVEQSPLLNGAKLLDRINELKRIGRTGKVERDFNDISPGAKRIAKLMLKCMVEVPPGEKNPIDTSDPRCMRDIATGNAEPLRLRADAVEIAHHFQLIGYSKGGNVVSDAMRYLVSELTAKNAQGHVFAISPESPTINGDGTAMTERNVSKIVRNIAVMALASVEVGMSDYYKAHGVRRVAINSNKDLISAHNNYADSVHDERWIIDGDEVHVGHAPEDMMGMRVLKKDYTRLKGYAHDDPRVARRLKEFFAPNFHKAAIGALTFNGHAHEGEVTVEAATGTSDHQMEGFAKTIETAVAKALKLRPSNVQFTSDNVQPGIFGLRCAGIDFTKSSDALGKLKRAFMELRSKNTQGLVVTQTILSKDGNKPGDIDKQIELVGGRGR